MKVALAVVAAFVTASPVPASVQHAISKKVPAHLRYVPTKAPLGFRYAKWDGTRSSLEIFFARNGRAPTLVFFAAAARTTGTCTAGGTHTYRFRSVRVFFERDRYDEQFWRCVRAGTVSVGASIRRAESLTAAKRRSIAAMVASATQLG